MKGLENLVGFGKRIVNGFRNVGYATVASVALVGMSGEAKAEGMLQLNSNLNSASSVDSLYLSRVIGASQDFVPGEDSPANSIPPGYHNLTAYLNGIDLREDRRPDNSDQSYTIRFLANESIGSNTPFSLVFSYPYSGYTFDSDPINFYLTDQSGNRTSPFYNVRDIIANNNGILNLGNVGPFNYNTPTEFARGKLDFNPVPEKSTLALLEVALLGTLATAGIRRACRGRNGPKTHLRLVR
jgi:hypothetical protein